MEWELFDKLGRKHLRISTSTYAVPRIKIHCAGFIGGEAERGT